MTIHRTHMLILNALGAALLALGIPSPASADGMTLEQVARLQAVMQAEVAPQGERVAFIRAVPRPPLDDDDGPPWRELHVADPDGTTRPYVFGESAVSAIAWTPSGDAITFLEQRDGDGHPALYSIALAGGEARRMARLETGISAYSLSPDGERVALLARDPLDEDVESQRNRGFRQIVYQEDWRDVAVWVADVDGNDEPRRLPIDGTVHQVQWSPDGSRLAVAVAPTPSVDDGLMFQRVRIVDAHSGEILERMDNPGKLGEVRWSPDGTHLAMISATGLDDPREGRLVVVPAEGGEQQDLLPGLEGHVWSVEWLDDLTIVFISHEGVSSRVAAIDRDGSNGRTLLDHGGPVWTSLSVGENGDIALVAAAPSHPPEAWLLPHGGDGATRLSDSNPWLVDVRLARQEVVTYTARDGLELQGLLIHPLDAQPGTRYPLILQVHGGPEAHYSNSWLTSHSEPGQVAAARGFAVFYPNYRASSGRGVTFSQLNHRDPAGSEFDDLVDGVDHLVAAGLVDGDRVGITGGSYGGYATAWGATYYSERFAAAVMNVGIADPTMMMLLGDIPREMYLVHTRVWPWEDPGLYRERSPLTHAPDSRTPLLILHGEEDTRVHPGHSLALYRALKLLDNAPVRLVLYPGEGHGNRRAASRYDYSLRLMRWMEHYLVGEGGEPPAYPLDYSAIGGE